MEITSDQKRTICAMLAEQAGYRIRSAEIAALCDDETIRAALLVLSSLVDVKYREVSAALAAAQAEQQRTNPQMMMGSPLSDSTLSVPADMPASPPATAHSALSAAEPEPLIVPSEQEDPVITDYSAATPQSAPSEEQASAEIDRLSSIFGQHAFLTDDPVVPPADNTITEPAFAYAEPVIINQLASPSDNKTTEPVFSHTEPATEKNVAPPADDKSEEFTFLYNEPVAADPVAPPADDNTGETTALTGSVFSDKSLFPEPAAISDPLKGGSWLFDDLDPDTDDTDTPVIGELPVPDEPQVAATSGSSGDTLRNHDWSFNTENSLLLQTDPGEYHSPADAEQKPWGLTALFAAGKENIPPQAEPATVRESAENTASSENALPENKAPETMSPSSGQPAVRIKIARARLLEPFSSPVTATLDDGRAVTILGIYFRRNIGLSFNDKTGNLHGTPTEYGEFPLRVVWELAPKKRFSSDIHFAVDPGSYSVTPAPTGFQPVQ
ncbi:hypothetical protein ACISK3_10005 [Morganella morganii]